MTTNEHDEQSERAELIRQLNDLASGNGMLMYQDPLKIIAKAAALLAADKAMARMEHDFPHLQQFHTKHALGPMLPPSCLCCGQQTHPLSRPVAIKHMELPGIVICKACKDATMLAEDKAGGELGTNEQCYNIYDAATHAAAIAVFMTRMDAEQPDADDKGVSGWLQEAEERVKRRATQPLETMLRAMPKPQPVPDDVAKDAERYRWLRNGDYPLSFAKRVLNDTPFGIDAAIDAAMLKEEK